MIRGLRSDDAKPTHVMDPPALRRWWPPAAVVVLLTVAALAAAHSRPEVERVEPRIDLLPTAVPEEAERLAERAAEAAPEAPAEAAGALPGWLGPVALTTLAVVVAVLVALVIWTVVRDRLRRAPGVRPAAVVPPPGRPGDEVVAALDAGLADLSDSDRDPRRAVIACWVRLEQAAAAAGTARRPGDAPGDLVGRLLAEQQVSAPVLAAFADVYRTARYATHTVDERMRAEARDALHRLRADLATGGRSGAAAGGGP